MRDDPEVSRLKKSVKMYSLWTWSLVDSKMETYLNSNSRNFIVGPGINSAGVYPSASSPTASSPTHGITSHLSDGMSGDRLWMQYNLQTLKSRLLSRITWNTEELEQILKNPSMMSEWRQCLEPWKGKIWATLKATLKIAIKRKQTYYKTLRVSASNLGLFLS